MIAALAAWRVLRRAGIALQAVFPCVRGFCSFQALRAVLFAASRGARLDGMQIWVPDTGCRLRNAFLVRFGVLGAGRIPLLAGERKQKIVLFVVGAAGGRTATRSKRIINIELRRT
ncbi:MAG: hypothetical protein ABIW82_14075 [Dokdonella sp.]